MIGLKYVWLFIVIYDDWKHHLFFTMNKINVLFKRVRRIFSWPILQRYYCFTRKVVEASVNKCIQQGWNILLKIYMYFKNIWPFIKIGNIWVLRDIPVKRLRRTNCTFVLDVLNCSCFLNIVFLLFAKQLPCEIVGIPSSLSFVIKRVFVFFIHCNVSINNNQ